jgi:hypothetical protein
MLRWAFVGAVLMANHAGAQFEREPVPVKQDETGLERREKRKLRSALFDVPGPAGILDDGDLTRAPGPIHVSLVPMPELPVSQADTILIGVVEDIQPYFSSDRKNIYSEYSIAVERVLKRHAEARFSDRVELVRDGFNLGPVRLPSDRVVSRPAFGYGKEFSKGGRCLFFLEYVPRAEAFRAWKTWRLHDGKAEPMANDDLRRAHLGESWYAGHLEEIILGGVMSQLK